MLTQSGGRRKIDIVEKKTTECVNAEDGPFLIVAVMLLI